MQPYPKGAAFLLLGAYCLLSMFFGVAASMFGLAPKSRMGLEVLLFACAGVVAAKKLTVNVVTIALIAMTTLVFLGSVQEGLNFGIDVAIENKNWLWMLLQLLLVYTVLVSLPSLRSGNRPSDLVWLMIVGYLVTLLVEGALVFGKFQPELVSIFDGKYDSVRYRTDLPSLMALVWPGFTGLNGLAVGAQDASIAAAICVAAHLRWTKKESRNAYRTLGLLLSLFVWSMCFTVTSFACFAAVVLFAMFFVKDVWFARPWVRTLTLCFFTGILANPRLALSWKIKSDKEWAYYTDSFRAPIESIASSETYNLLFGFGRLATGGSTEGVEVKAHDFGWGVEMIRHGVILVGLLWVGYALLAAYALRLMKQDADPRPRMINLFVSMILFVSLIHYPTIYANGFRQLFILTTAIAVLPVFNFNRAEA